MRKIVLMWAPILLACAFLVWLAPLQSALDAVVRHGAAETTTYTLLVVPLGVVAIVGFRLIVGLETFGLFAPLILAFAFYRISPLVGVTLFATLLLLVTPVGHWLSKFSILSSARTGILLTLTALMLIFAMAYVPLLSGRLTLVDLGLPIVAISGLMDRFVSAQLDQSPFEAIKLSIKTLAVAVLVAVAIVGNETLRRWIHAHPDALWLCVPLCVLMGRYTGLRFNEIWRFRVLRGSAGKS